MFIYIYTDLVSVQIFSHVLHLYYFSVVDNVYKMIKNQLSALIELKDYTSF